MIVLEKLKDKEMLSPNEQIVAEYLLSYEDNIMTLSASDISKNTYTSASTTVRLAKKLGYEGWLELREVLYTEKNYLQNSLQDIDASFPFTRMDSLHSITSRIEQLEISTIQETKQLIHHDELSKCIQFLSKAQRIYVFAMANTSSITYDFQFKMRFLFKEVVVINNRDDFSFVFQTLKEDDCCIFISYSGQTFERLELSDLIRSAKCSTIGITSYHQQVLTSCTKAHLYIPHKERDYAKIGHFSSNTAIHYLLDVLYACVFNKNYDLNMEKRETYVESTDRRNIRDGEDI